ncbi:hypothetical protein ACFVYR_12340 [Streptomyces sp. NPDC058284]|uniref:hypothetical protein n=1 Tax=unclassified Streptomyces TaxID=2593676 RepID=UPI00365D3AE7
MRKNLHRISSAFVATIAVAGLTLGAGCSSDESSTPAPKSESATEKAQQEKGHKPQGRSERADLVRFQLDDRSQSGFNDIWVVWTIKNNSSDKSDYTWDWEAVNADGTRVENGSQLETDVQPGQSAKGEYPTTLHSTSGIKLNITSFDRTASY